MKKILPFFLLLFPVLHSTGQELDCVVSVSSPQLEGTDKQVFQTLQTAIYEFMNDRVWSKYQINIEERIECTILLTVNERLSTNQFRGTLNLVLRRPVFNSAYNSVLLNYIERDFTFSYIEYQTLDYSDGMFSSNLTSTLAFYTYVFLGLYFDSYALYAGAPFFEKAQEIVNLAQNTQESGWKAFENTKNKYWIAANLINPANQGIRQFSYQYHRLGLDQMYERVDLGRGEVTKGLAILQQLYNEKPDLFMLQLTLDAKKDEFVNIFSDQRVPPMEKNNVVNLLKDIDPANSSKYQAILDGK